MKKLIKGALFLAIVGTVVIGCEKEENINPMTSTNQVENSIDKTKSNQNKSTYSDLELMAMAANIDEINYNGSNQYEVTMFGSSNTYTIDIISFDEESNINMGISDGSNTFELVVDVNNETISLSTIHSSSFDDYESYLVSSASNVIENISNIMIVHHATEPNQSQNFSNNGNDDQFPTNNTDKAKFWGWQTGVSYGPCVGQSRKRKDCYKVLFISVNCEDTNVVCGP